MEEKKRDSVVVASKVKDVVRAAGCQSSSDLITAVSDKVHELIEAAAKRAKDNGRATIRAYDL